MISLAIDSLSLAVQNERTSDMKKIHLVGNLRLLKVLVGALILSLMLNAILIIGASLSAKAKAAPKAQTKTLIKKRLHK